MGALAIIAALLLEQWRPLAGRREIAAALARWANRLERRFNAGEPMQGSIAWGAAVLPALAACLALYYALAWANPLLGLALNVAALYLTLGFRQFSHYFTEIQAAVKAGELERAREQLGAWRGESAAHLGREEVVRLAIEQAIAAAHRHVFGVLFWFMLLPGPSGAVLYRLAAFLARRWSGSGAFGRFAERACYALEWPSVRFTACAFAIVGDFEDAVYCWRTQARAWPDANLGVLLAAGAGAIGVRLGMPLAAAAGGLEPRPELGTGEPADGPFLDSTVGLLWRALVLWVFVLIVLALARTV